MSTEITEVLDERFTFRLPALHKKLIEQEARKRYGTAGDVLREIVRDWANRKRVHRDHTDAGD